MPAECLLTDGIVLTTFRRDFYLGTPPIYQYGAFLYTLCTAGFSTAAITAGVGEVQGHSKPTHLLHPIDYPGGREGSHTYIYTVSQLQGHPLATYSIPYVISEHEPSKCCEYRQTPHEQVLRHPRP